jgi:dihydrofolate synthase/folylpolyglutamate synthase
MPTDLPVTLEQWLSYIEVLHHRPIDLGLERVRAVAQRLGLDGASGATRILVGGTNGKGSTCALLEAIYRAAGYRVGRYGSPHLVRFNERALIGGRQAGDEELAQACAAVEQVRGDTTLTYFEFSTLAVLWLFARQRLDVEVLEVGLGGRLDAVNLIDADCAIVTTVDLDHTELLGGTRERIGLEKAHIYRAGRPALCVDPAPPDSLVAYAQAIGAPLRRLGVDFGIEAGDPALAQRQWSYWSTRAGGARRALPWPALRGSHQLRNAAGVLAVLEALASQRPVDQQAVRQGLAGVQLAGRFQVLPGRPAVILDVAHNPHAAQALAQALREHAQGPGGGAGRTLAVFGMLRDKDARGVVAAMAPLVQAWYLAGTGGERGQGAEALQRAAFAGLPAGAQHGLADVAQALAAAQEAATPDDRIVVFGSFVIVAEAMRCLERGSR